MQEIKEFVQLCRYYGGLSELSQHGGGNISVKYSNKPTDNRLIIKASGEALADITDTHGYDVISDYKNLNLDNKDNKYSIELPFHIFMKKYTVHLHPCLIIKYMSELKKNNPFKCLFIKYFKPGNELANEIKKVYDNQELIFLENHGIIFTSDSFASIIKLINNTYDFFVKTYDQSFTLLNEYIPLCDEYKGSIITRARQNIEKLKNVTPDTTVYLNKGIIQRKGKTYIIGKNKYQCFKIQEVLDSYSYLFDLPEINSDELISWDKEKARLLK